MEKLTDALCHHQFEFVLGHRKMVEGFCLMHQHPSIEIVYHPRGTGVTRLRDGTTFHYAEDGLVVYPPGVEHSQTMTETGEDWVIHLRSASALPQECLETMQLAHVDCECMRMELDYLSAHRSQPDPLTQQILNSRVTALYAAIVQGAIIRQGSCNRDPRVEQAYNFIQRNYPFIRSVQEAADHVGLGYDRLRHLFAEAYGKSLKRCLLETRIRRAKQLLLHTPSPLKAIAADVGIANERYLCTLFRQEVGQTPVQYRGAH